jgi:phosphohistidine phosphatase
MADFFDLYFLRHGIAVDHGAAGFSEETRPLTKEGEEKMHRAAEGMKRLELSFDVLMSSPLVRARQTAQMVQKLIHPKKEVEIEPLLLPGKFLLDFLKRLRGRKEKSFLLVGHEPSMSEWIHELLKGGPQSSIEMKKGALCQVRVDLDLRGWNSELIFLASSKMLRLMSEKKR